MRKAPFLAAAVCLIAHAAAADAPEKALKYHAVLLKRPHNAALFDRFYGAWLDEQSVEAMGDFLKARADKNGGAEWGVLATWQLRQGAEDDALESLAKAISAQPADSALRMERAKVLLRRLDFDKARADLAAVASGSDEALALEAGKLVGKSRLREGNVDKAVAAWNAVLAAHPADEDLLEDLVETAAGEGEAAQALVYLDKLIGLGADPYKKTLRMLRRGDLLAQAGKTDDAVKSYAETLAQTGADSWLEREVLAQIDKLFRKQDRLDDLSAELEKLAAANPQRLSIQRQLAKLEIARGETDKAIGRFREVLKRSPGDRQLREEFIRLLGDGERYDEAVAELEKLAANAPADAELPLQIAGLRSRQNQPDAALAELEKAHKLLGDDEGSGLRIAGLMLNYHLEKPGEALLKALADKPGASPTVLEALASRYGQTQRKDEAVALLKKAGSGKDLDALLRTTGSISALGESAAAFDVLKARQEEFAAEPRFLAAYCQAALAAEKPTDAVPQALKLVRMATQTSELADGIGLATRVISGAKKAEEIRGTLEKQDPRTPAETCLLASLIEDAGDQAGVESLLGPAKDPMVVHFHAALLDRRGDFGQAIAVMTRLADTDEGRKAAYFKDLAELQQRADRPKEALATVERWKLAAPGDKTAWVVGSRLLRQLGKPEEAVKMTRHAVARFEGDVDLQASLASLHEEAGQWADAEAIYWRLYDEGHSPADQARWAAQLAQLAQRTGTAAELAEKFQERQRGNRRSIGPLLAQAELARVTRDEEKRRDLLLEAVRLQPKDLDLRMQIAEIEEKVGNPERAQAVLEEALPFDENGRVRSALAQSYLRQGEAVKGMRELRALSGKSGFDARSAEAAAATLAGIQLYAEAIDLLRGELKDGGDWRSRYLLASLLEEDGREAEAEPIFLSLLAATGEIPALAPLPGANSQSYNPYGNVPENLKKIVGTMTAAQVAYAQRDRNGNSYYGRQQGFTKVGNFLLPDEPEKARQFAAFHLAKLADRGGKRDEALVSRMKAGGVANPDFLVALATLKNPDGQPDTAKLLAKFPELPGLAEYVLSYGGMYGRETAPDELRKIVASAPDLSPRARFGAWSRIASTAPAGDPAWANLAAAAKEWIADNKDDSSSMITWQLLQLLLTPKVEIGAADRQALKEAILASQAKSDEKHPEWAHGTGSLNIAAAVGTTDEWLAELNAVVRKFRETQAKGQRGGSPFGNHSQMLRYALQNMANGNGGEQVFAAPSLDRLAVKSLPQEVPAMVLGADRDNNYAPPPLKPDELLKRAGEIESPLLVAIVAMKSGDAEAIEKAMAAKIPAVEEVDFQVLRAVLAMQNKQPLKAFETLDKARESGGRDKDFTLWANTSLLGVAGEMTADERAKLADRLEPIIMQCRQSFGQQGTPILAAEAHKLGLEDLAKRLQPLAATAGTPGAASTGPAALAPAPQNSSSGRQPAGGSEEKVRQFVAKKKYEAAAREVLTGLRGQTNNRDYYLRQQIPQFATMLGKDGVAALLAMLDPGDSRSLVRRLEYADVCIAIGKPELAAPVLEALAKERPDDASIAGRLILTLDPADPDHWAALMTRAAKSEEFVAAAGSQFPPFKSDSDTKAKLDYFDMLAGWLEKTDSAELANANLTWVTYHSKRFFDGEIIRDLGSLFQKPGKPNSKADKKQVAERARHKKIGERLARAMLRYPAMAEEGFRLLAASKAWELKPEETDTLARQALLATASIPKNSDSRNGRQVAYFQYQSNHGGSSSGGDLSEDSSVAWLAGRLAKEKTAEILPPVWLARFTAANPEAGKILTSLANKPDAAAMEAMWNSGAMASDGSDRISASLRPLLMKRIASAPGSAAFFKKLLLEIPPGQATDRSGNGGDQKNRALVTAALEAAALGNPAELDEIAKAVKVAVFGNVEFSETEPVEAGYSELNFLEQTFQNQFADPVAAVRIQQAFFRLGVPTGDDEYGAIRSFQGQKFTSTEDVVKFFGSLGWLADAAHWEPFSAMRYNRSGQAPGGNGYLVTAKPWLALERVMQSLNFPGDREDLAKKLAEGKSPTFGTLMMSAAMNSGAKREEYADRAFKESAVVLAKLPDAKIQALAPVLPWLSDAARAKLPEKFRNNLKHLDEANRKAAIARADAFLKNLASNASSSNSGFGNGGDEFSGVLFYAPEKAVEMFVAGDEAFTASLARGGRYAYTSRGDWQVAARDYFFGSLMQTYGQEGRRQAVFPAQMFDFIAGILATPTGARLQLGSSAFISDSLFAVLAKPLLGKAGSGEPVERLETLVATYREWRKKSPVEVVFPTFLLANLEFREGAGKEAVKGVREKIAALTKDDQPAADVAEMAFAPWAWKVLSPEEKSAATATCVRLLADKKIPQAARMELAARWLSIMAEGPLDPALADAVGALYRDYCVAGRSAVSPASNKVFGALLKSPSADEAGRKLAATLSAAFWENAGASNAAGHPPVPSKLAQSVFLLAVRGGDKEAVAKTFPRVRDALAGKLEAMISLLESGQADLARQIAPLPGELFTVAGKSGNYDRALESAVADFAKIKADPLTLRKLEIELLARPAVRGNDAPKESDQARAARIAADFAANPFQGDALQWALESLLDKAPGNPQLLEILMKWAAAHPVGNFIILGNNSSAMVQNRSRLAAIRLHGRAAIHGFDSGDATLLKALTTAIDVTGTSNYYLYQDLSRLTRAMTRMFWVDVCTGATNGLKGGTADLDAFILGLAKQIQNYNSSETERPLMIANLVHGWNGDAAGFEKLCAALPEQCKSIGKRISKTGGFMAFAVYAHEYASSGDPALSRGAFLAKVLVQPGFSPSYAKEIGWVGRLRGGDYKEEIDAIAANPPAGIPREAMVELHEQAGDMKLEEDPKAAAAEYKSALESCTDAKEWAFSRGVMKWKMADAMLTQGDKDGAKAAFGKIGKDEIADWLKGRYNDLAKKLDAPAQ